MGQRQKSRAKTPAITIPKTTQIAGHQIQVKLDLAGYAIPVRLVKDLQATEECAGRWSNELRRIDIDFDIAQYQEELCEVLIHECAHAVSDFYGLDIDEQRVRILALGLHQMLKPFIKVKL